MEDSNDSLGLGCILFILIACPVLFLTGHYSSVPELTEAAWAFTIFYTVMLVLGVLGSGTNTGCVLGLFIIGFWWPLIYLVDPISFNLPSVFTYVGLPFCVFGIIFFGLFTNENEEKTGPEEINEEIVKYLIENPETPRKELEKRFEKISKGSIQLSIYEAFKRLLNAREYGQARALLDYYRIDDNNLLSVIVKLDEVEKIGSVSLEPQTYKITMANGETAYEKLPCNWQKIHTYLAPLEDEIEQADILDSGNIYITDQRVFFVGTKGSETVYLSDIAYMDYKEDALQFFRDEGLSEIFAFPTPHHATYARLVIEELMDRQT